MRLRTGWGLMRERARPIWLLRSFIVAAAGLYVWMLASGIALSAPSSMASASEYEYGHKVAICHMGHTIVVDSHATSAHEQHGDTLGPCPGDP